MAAKRKPELRGIAAPTLTGEPLFLRLCAAFVDNLTLLLRTALVVSGLLDSVAVMTPRR